MNYSFNKSAIAMQIIDDEAIFIDLGRGLYFSLDPIGTFVFNSLCQGADLDQVLVLLTERYQQPADRIRRDIEQFIDSLEQAGILLRHPSEAQRAAGGSAAPDVPYAAPQLETFDDLQDLLALDLPMPDLP